MPNKATNASQSYVQSFYSFLRQLCYRRPMNAYQSSDKPLESILERAREAANGEGVDLKDLVQAFGDRAFGPVMILCSLFLMTPIGIIPGLPAAFGLIVIIFAMQLLFRQALTALLAILLAITLVPLGVVPFGVVAPAFIIGLLGLGITARDGVLIIIGFVLSLGVAYGVTSLILTRF